MNVKGFITLVAIEGAPVPWQEKDACPTQAKRVYTCRCREDMMEIPAETNRPWLLGGLE